MSETNAIPVTCANGHPLDAKNLYVAPNGKWNCRHCNALAYRKRKKLSLDVQIGEMRPRGLSLEERFLSDVTPEPNCGCWIWDGGISKGYGIFHADGVTHRAYVWAYRHFVGPFSDGLELDHLCRITCCVNPQHLEPVTPYENWRRGMAPSAKSFRTNICARGHSFTPENTYIMPNGGRRCRACRNDYLRRWRATHD